MTVIAVALVNCNWLCIFVYFMKSFWDGVEEIDVN